MTSPPRQAPVRAPALVLERWNNWVKVYLPDFDEERWVDLDRQPYTPLAGAPPQGTGDAGSGTKGGESASR